MPTGPATVASNECDSGRSSSVQIAPVAPQSVVSGSVTVTGPCPDGSTWIVQLWLLPCCSRSALRTSPPLTSNASSRNVL